VAAVFEQRSVGLELQTGKPVWEQEVDLRDGYGVRGQFADVDGDGHDDALLFGEQLTALALRTGKLLWRSPLKGADLKYETSLPLTADLVSGGAKGVVVPIGGFGPGGWRGVKVLDGATGQPRWQRELEPSGRPNFSGWGGDWGREGPHNHFIAGPDIDADDQQEVFVVTLAGEGPQSGRFNLCVDALSGQDGHLVWSSQHPIVSRITNSVAGLGQLRWWQVGADGWPLLVVPFQNKSGSHEREDVAFFFLAGTGRIAHRVEGCHEPEMPDLTGDGLPDLCWLESLVAGGKKLHALRGAPPAVWRRRELWKPAADFDADGITDLVSSGSFDIGGVAWNGRSAGKSSPRGDPAAAQITLGGAVGGAPILPKVAAVSGRDGTILWRSEKQWQCSGVPPLRHADLDGDGIADLLGVWEGGAGTAGYRTAISALSGKTGQVLWTVERTADASRAIQASTFRFMTTCDLEGDGRTEVLFGHLGSGVPTFSLEVLFGRDGAPRWTQSWQWKQIAKQWVLLYRLEALANLDGDATLDLVLRTTTGEFQGPVSEAELLAFSGADGKLLWRRKGQTLQSQIGDLDGDGLAEVIVIEDALIALDGKTGQTKWTWQWSDPGKPSSGGGSVRPLCGPVLANLDGGDRRCVCLLLPDETVILDAHGKVRCRTALPEAARSQRGFVPSEVPVQLWPYDVDADGRDELLFLLAYPADGPDPLRFAQTLRVTADGAERVLWEWALPHGFGQVLEILPPAGGRPATIVVQAGDDVYGLAGPTGIPVWRCDGLSRWIQDPRLWQSYLVLPPTLLPASDPQGFPRILFYPADRWQFEGTDCRLALPTSPDGKYLPPDEAAVAYRRPADDGKPIKPAEPQERGDRELTILKNLARQCPEVSAFGRQLARHHVERCCALAQAGRPDEARAEFQKAESAWHLQAKRFQAKEKGYRDALKASPDNPDANHDLAWFLATCPDPHFRDPHKAVELAKRAMELSSPGTWHRVRDVGVAQYRAGDWQAAIVALERAAPGGWDAFYLAMSYQQLGDKEKARQWYDKALSYAKSQTAEREYEELMYLRAEAAVLMATGQAPASGKPVKKE
jgi:outer membrane protein assembly factor BamB/tetratricopeptide (TPR) repeat protein